MSLPLYKYLNNLGKKSLYIKELKGEYTPVELSSQLKTLEEQKMIHINWVKKVITVKFNFENLLNKKNDVTKYKRTVPEYMKVKEREINKPFI